MIFINRFVKDLNYRVFIIGVMDRYVFRFCIKNFFFVFFIVIYNGNIYMIRCIYVVKLKDICICFVCGIFNLN